MVQSCIILFVSFSALSLLRTSKVASSCQHVKLFVLQDHLESKNLIAARLHFRQLLLIGTPCPFLEEVDEGKA
jgi:hypothetical protein